MNDLEVPGTSELTSNVHSSADIHSADPDTSQPLPRTHSVHVRDVPEVIWRHARTNALLSGLPFKAYVTKLLEHSTPFPTTTATPAANPAESPQVN